MQLNNGVPRSHSGPASFVGSRQRTITFFFALSAAVALASATSVGDASVPVVQNPVSPLAIQAVANVENDQVMGRLRPVAQTVAAGLQNPSLLKATWATLRDKKTNAVGLDLQRCDRASVAAHLIGDGARRIGGNSATLCRLVGEFKGMVLYMDWDRLQAWDGVSPVIVTAIEDPNAERPQYFAGFRLNGEVVALPSDGSITEPVLVVLPMSNRAVRRGPPPSFRAVQVPDRQR